MTVAAVTNVEALGLDLLHLSPSIGTEVHGINLADDLGEEIIQSLSDLLVERKVIFYRDQELTMQQQIEFARRFFW